MSKFSLRFVFVIFLLAALTGAGQAATLPQDPPPAYNQWVYLPMVIRSLPPMPSWMGPAGGSTVYLLSNPKNGQELYAGSWGAGVFKSTDGGANWFPSSLGINPAHFKINSMAIDSLNPSTVYAGTYGGGVYKSVNAGLSWTQTSAGMQPAIVYSMAVDPENSNRVYAATRKYNLVAEPWGGELYRSDNGGASWSVILKDIGGANVQDWVYSIAILPLDSNVIIAASHEHGPYISTNYGNSWRSVGGADPSGRSVVFDPTTDETNYRAYYAVWHLSGFYRSNNLITAWTSCNPSQTDIKIYPNSFILDRSDPAWMFAGNFYLDANGNLKNGGVLRSNDSCGYWNKVGLANRAVYITALNQNNPSQVYAGVVGNEGIWRSVDRGASWFASNTGYITVPALSTVASSSGSVMLMVGGIPGKEPMVHTMYLSTDQGITWSLYNSGLSPEPNRVVANPANGQQFFALTKSGVYRITVGAGGWTRASAPRLDSLFPAQPGLDGTGSGQADWLNELRQLMPDEDWAPAPVQRDAVSPSASILALAFEPANPSRAYLGGSGTGVYTSTDNGANWSPAGLSGATVYDLVVQPGSGKVYAATSQANTVKVSANNGAAWSDTAVTGTPKALAASTADVERVYVGTSSGVYVSVSGGAWTPAGLSGQSITALAAHPNRPGFLVAGTGAGAYYTTDYGATWQAGPPEVNYMRINAVSFDPVEPGWVYLSTGLSGAFRWPLTP